MTKPAETVTVTVRMVWMVIGIFTLIFLTGIGLLVEVKGWRVDTRNFTTVVEENNDLLRLGRNERLTYQDGERAFDCREYEMNTPSAEPIYLCEGVPDPADVAP